MHRLGFNAPTNHETAWLLWCHLPQILDLDSTYDQPPKVLFFVFPANLDYGRFRFPFGDTDPMTSAKLGNIMQEIG